METKTTIQKIAHNCGLIEVDLRIARAIKSSGDPMSRAERIRELLVNHRAHRAALLLDVACLCEQATIEIGGKNFI